MIDLVVLKAIAEQSVAALLAVVFLLVMRQVYQQRLDETAGDQERECQRADRMVEALEGNSRVLTETAEAMRALRGEVESCPLRHAVENGATRIVFQGGGKPRGTSAAPAAEQAAAGKGS